MVHLLACRKYPDIAVAGPRCWLWETGGVILETYFIAGAGPPVVPSAILAQDSSITTMSDVKETVSTQVDNTGSDHGVRNIYASDDEHF